MHLWQPRVLQDILRQRLYMLLRRHGREAARIRCVLEIMCIPLPFAPYVWRSSLSTIYSIRERREALSLTTRGATTLRRSRKTLPMRGRSFLGTCEGRTVYHRRQVGPASPNQRRRVGVFEVSPEMDMTHFFRCRGSVDLVCARRACQCRRRYDRRPRHRSCLVHFQSCQFLESS